MLLRKTIILIILLSSGRCLANDSLEVKADSGTVTILLQNAYDKLSRIDSVYLVIDRYDLRGAGVIKQVFYPDRENKVTVNVPSGKYYMNIYCLGIYNKECFDRIITARRRKNRNIFLRLQVSALYKQGLASIPADHFDPSKLAIMHLNGK